MAFALNRAYILIDKFVDEDEIDKIIRGNNKFWRGWFPTAETQSPAWAKKYKADDFIAYWIY